MASDWQSVTALIKDNLALLASCAAQATTKELSSSAIGFTCNWHRSQGTSWFCQGLSVFWYSGDAERLCPSPHKTLLNR